MRRRLAVFARQPLDTAAVARRFFFRAALRRHYHPAQHIIKAVIAARAREQFVGRHRRRRASCDSRSLQTLC